VAPAPDRSAAGAFQGLLLLAVGPSRLLSLAIVAAYGAATLATLLAGIPPVARWLLVGILLADGGRALRRHGLRSGDTVREIRLRGDGRLRIRAVDGTLADCTLLPGGLIADWLTVLPLRTKAGHRYTAILVADNVDPAEFRRLRVRLRFPPAQKPPPTKA